MNEINSVNNNPDKAYIIGPDKRVKKNNKPKNTNIKKLSPQELKDIIHRENPEYDIDQLIEEIKKINKEINDKEVVLSYNKEIDRMIITIINKKNSEIISEYPCKEIQKLTAHIKNLIGIIYDKKA